MITRIEDIGGGFVRRGFAIDGEYQRSGTRLERDVILSMPHLNRQSLIDGGYLSIYPPAPHSGDMHLISRGFGKYDVIRGEKLNIEPLTKEQAEAMMPGAPAEAETN